MSFIGIIFVLFLTYYGTKWLSTKANNMSKSKYMNIVDKIVLGQNKYLAIVEISNKYYLMSISDNSISILKEIHELELVTKECTNQTTINMDFSKILSRIIKKDKDYKND